MFFQLYNSYNTNSNNNYNINSNNKNTYSNSNNKNKNNRNSKCAHLVCKYKCKLSIHGALLSLK